LLPGLLDTVARNVARGMPDLALFHVGQVVLARPDASAPPTVPVDRRPTVEQVAALLAALPEQPVHVAVALTGARERPGWWGAGRPASWADAVQAARLVGEVAGVVVQPVAADLPPWHPGRCAALRVAGLVVGHAGELHPKVLEALQLPPRTCAAELDLDALPLIDRRPAPVISPFPPVLLDVALVVDADQPVAEVSRALAEGAGELLEQLRLFDVYTGEQVGPGKRSLAFSLRLRAADRTLTSREATQARDAAVALAAQRCGAVVRG
jgi:phenylalanyl-tRNA synthetase beta chain